MARIEVPGVDPPAGIADQIQVDTVGERFVPQAEPIRLAGLDLEGLGHQGAPVSVALQAGTELAAVGSLGGQLGSAVVFPLGQRAGLKVTVVKIPVKRGFL